MTKKAFKEMCSFHCYGKGQNKRNAIYYGWASEGHKYAGFQYMVKASVERCSKAELFNALYDWVNGGILVVPYYVQYRYAQTDAERFKVSLMG